MANRFSLYLLGTFQVKKNEEPVTHFEYDKVRALLAYLAVEAGRPHRRDELTGLLWSDQPDKIARKSLNQALYTLRKAMGDKKGIEHPFILANRTSVQINPTADVWLDVQVFEAGATTVSTNQQDSKQEAHLFEQLKKAATLYQGDFLKGLSISDSLALDEWLALTRERLHRQAIELLDRLTEIETQRGEWQQALSYARRQVELEPWREEAHFQMMLLLARTGDTNAAITQYEICKTILAAELGLTPMPKTTRLQRRIINVRNGDYPHNIPQQKTELVGRESELQQLKQLLAHPQNRLITLVGPGGIGKTQLAIAAARQNQQRFLEGVIFVPLAALSEPEQIITSVASNLNFPIQADARRSPAQQLLDYLRRKEILLVLDNFEHLIDGTEFLAEILRTAPDIHLLVTSRERLQLQSEQQFPVIGLDYPEVAHGNDLTLDTQEQNHDGLNYAAGKLFLKAARQQQPSFMLKKANEFRNLVVLSNLVAGMPLALELAASWADMLSLPDILTEVQKSIDILQSEQRDMPERHRSIRAVFDSSWQLLSAQEQAIFSGLSVFRGGFTREAAKAITGATLRELSRLNNKSLMVYDRENGRYHIHELLRQYGEEKLTRDSEQVSAKLDLHARYYLTFLYSKLNLLKGDEQERTIVEIERELDNVIKSWNWAANKVYINLIDLALESLWIYLDWCGRFKEGLNLCKLAAEKITGSITQETVIDGNKFRVLAKVLIGQSTFIYHLNPVMAEQLLERSQELLNQPELTDKDIRAEQALIFLRKGNLARRLAPNLAEHLCKKALVLFQEIEDDYYSSGALMQLGIINWRLCNYVQAKNFLNLSLSIQKNSCDQRGIAATNNILSRILTEQGYLEKAEYLHREVLATRQSMGLKLSVTWTLTDFAETLIWCGKFTEARLNAKTGIESLENLGLEENPRAYIILAHSLLHLGEYSLAQEYIQKSLPISQGKACLPDLGYAYYIYGNIALVKKDYKVAEKRLSKSVSIFQKDRKNLVRLPLTSCIYTAYYLGGVVKANQLIFNLLKKILDFRDFLSLISILPIAALIFNDQKKRGRAFEIYTLATQYLYVKNSQWFADLVSHRFTDTRVDLSPEIMIEIQAKIQKRDLWAMAVELLDDLHEESPTKRGEHVHQ